jgi:hypothetical protein
MKTEVHDALQEGTALAHKPDILSKMPTEIMLMILSHLNISSLVSFGATSHANYMYHTLCLKRLHLAVFQKRFHTTIAFIEASSSTLEQSGHWDMDAEHHVCIILPRSNRGKEVVGPRSPSRGSRWSMEIRRRSWDRDDENPLANETIRAQNDVLAALLSRYGRGLNDLEFMAYDLDFKGAVALATHCKWKLRHLALRFEHPYIRDAMLPRGYWMQPAPSSTVWNALIGSGEYKKDMGSNRPREPDPGTSRNHSVAVADAREEKPKTRRTATQNLQGNPTRVPELARRDREGPQGRTKRRLRRRTALSYRSSGLRTLMRYSLRE